MEIQKEYISIIEDLRSYGTQLDGKVSRYRDKLRISRAEVDRLKNEVDILRSSITSHSIPLTAAQHQEKAFLEEQLFASQSEVKKINVERQKLLSKFKLQKRELKLIKDVQKPTFYF